MSGKGITVYGKQKVSLLNQSALSSDHGNGLGLLTVTTHHAAAQLGVNEAILEQEWTHRWGHVIPADSDPIGNYTVGGARPIIIIIIALKGAI